MLAGGCYGCRLGSPISPVESASASLRSGAPPWVCRHAVGTGAGPAVGPASCVVVLPLMGTPVARTGVYDRVWRLWGAGRRWDHGVRGDGWVLWHPLRWHGWAQAWMGGCCLKCSRRYLGRHCPPLCVSASGAPPWDRSQAMGAGTGPARGPVPGRYNLGL